MEICSTW